MSIFDDLEWYAGNIFIDLEYFERELIPPNCGPLSWGTEVNGRHVKQALSTLSDEEARVVKRKFRKLHRKLKRDHLKIAEKMTSRSGFKKYGRHDKAHKKITRERYANHEKDYIDRGFGSTGCVPSISQSRFRRIEVFKHLKAKAKKD